MLRLDYDDVISGGGEAQRELKREWETGLRSQAATTRNASGHQRDTVMNETTFYEGTTHEPATGPTSTSQETAHETIAQEISTHETPGLDILPREYEYRNPRLAEEEYDDPHANREPHSLKRRREGPQEQELRDFEESF